MNDCKNLFPEKWFDISSLDHFWFEWRIASFMLLLETLKIPVDQTWSVLDIGCGRGILRTQLENLTSWVVDGIDVDEKAIRANPRLKGRAFVCDILNNKNKINKKYNAVILFDILEHVENELAFLNATLNMVENRGYLFVNVPAHQIFHGQYDVAVGHLRRYSDSNIKKLLSSSGCYDIIVNYWGGALLPLLILRNIMCRNKKSVKEIIKRGFEPPTPMVNFILKKCGVLERKLMRFPPFGASLIAVARSK